MNLPSSWAGLFHFWRMSSGSFRINRVSVATLPDCAFFGFSVPKLLRRFAIIVGMFISFLKKCPLGHFE